MAALSRTDPSASRRPQTNNEKRMELTEHLGELRSRLIRSFLLLMVGAVVAYQFFAPLYGLLYRPLNKEMKRLNQERAARGYGDDVFVAPVAQHNPPDKADYDKLGQSVQWIYDHPRALPQLGMVFRNFHEPFMVRLKISIVYGFILVLPLVIRELFAFITPALTPEERRPLRLLIPISAFLLACGIAVAYFTMFFAMRWFLSYLDDFPPPANLLQDPNDYVLFFVKMMAAFGLAFQLPVVLMGGAFVGIVTSKGLIKHWRWGVVVAALGGLLTPSNDIISMALMSIPLLLLYAGSIVLVRFVERSKAKRPLTPAP